jgi:hypothetical protein
VYNRLTLAFPALSNSGPRPEFLNGKGWKIMPGTSIAEVVTKANNPKCPKCGSTVVTLYDTHDSYSFGNLQGVDEPTSTITAYSCVCGVAFTEMRKYRKQPLIDA